MSTALRLHMGLSRMLRRLRHNPFKCWGKSIWQTPIRPNS